MNRACVWTLVLGLGVPAVVSGCAAASSDDVQPELRAGRLQEHEDEHPEHAGPTDEYFFGAPCSELPNQGVPWLPAQRRCGTVEEESGEHEHGAVPSGTQHIVTSPVGNGVLFCSRRGNTSFTDFRPCSAGEVCGLIAPSGSGDPGEYGCLPAVPDWEQAESTDARWRGYCSRASYYYGSCAAIEKVDADGDGQYEDVNIDVEGHPNGMVWCENGNPIFALCEGGSECGNAGVDEDGFQYGVNCLAVAEHHD